MSEPAQDELAQATFSDFYEAFGPKTATKRAALIWRMPKTSPIVICKPEHSTDGRA